jgi:cell pole-organizing protein PopZ
MSISNQPIGGEQSMDEILSSIRRVLKDSETVTVPAEHHGSAAETDGEPVMVLDSSMMVSEPTGQANTRPAQEAIASTPTLSSATPPGTAATDQPYEPHRAAAATPTGAVEPPQPILGAQAAEAAASHFGALMRTVSADRSLAVSRGGISIEDIVREEIRPMLKSWLDAHLPGLVERVVRAEIERLVGRDGS